MTDAQANLLQSMARTADAISGIAGVAAAPWFDPRSRDLLVAALPSQIAQLMQLAEKVQREGGMS